MSFYYKVSTGTWTDGVTSVPMSADSNVAAVTITVTPPGCAAPVTLANFGSVPLCLNGTTAQNVNALRLVQAVPSQAGTAFTSTRLDITSFATSFTFQMTNGGGSDGTQVGADGLTFTIQSAGATQVGGGGGGIGYLGILSSVGVEFDTWNNGAPTDADSNHLGIDVNGVLGASADTVPVAQQFDNGSVWTAWINYNGITLDVYVSPTGVQPASPTLSRTINIPAAVGGSTAYVGFTAATGAAFENTEILSWSYALPR